MHFEPLAIPGCYLVTASQYADDRGAFRRVYNTRALNNAKLPVTFAQSAISQNHYSGTVRGLHYQAAPQLDAKLVSCIRGATFEILVDLRQGASFGRTVTVEIAATRFEAVYVAEGVAHGFQTLTDDAELLYAITAPYERELARGVRWDDPLLDIQLPLPISIISDQDRNWPDIEVTHPASCAGLTARPRPSL